jgi:UDP-GlcNAc3NAcA epimerase
MKLAPLSLGLSGLHEEIIVHTSQHNDYAMSEKIFSDLVMREPDIHLEINSGSPTSQITQMLLKLEAEMVKHKPALAIVFGDTNSTFAGAMIAAKLNIPIVHIEAGLRSYNRGMSEEINRIVTDHVSKYLFAPTHLGIALQKSPVITELKLDNVKYNLLTLHRNYNVDDTKILEHLLNQLGELGEKIIFPVHPRTRKMLADTHSVPENIQMTDPQGYLDYIALEHSAKRIITDSGGIQKEAYILKKPCITLRTETEWVETVKEKWNLLVNPAEKKIASKIASFTPPNKRKEVFGKNVSKKMILIRIWQCKKHGEL